MLEPDWSFIMQVGNDLLGIEFHSSWYYLKNMKQKLLHSKGKNKSKGGKEVRLSKD